MNPRHRVAITLVGLLVLTYLAAAEREDVQPCAGQSKSACGSIPPQAMVNLRP